MRRQGVGSTAPMEMDDAGAVKGYIPVTGVKLLPMQTELEITVAKAAPATGDNGVAIYMVMALLTLCGGAALVVGKKKELF